MSAPDELLPEALAWLTHMIELEKAQPDADQKAYYSDNTIVEPRSKRIEYMVALRNYLRAPTAPQGAEPVAHCPLCGNTHARCPKETPLYAAPQGAEIAREALQAARTTIVNLLELVPAGTTANETLAAINAALTPTDAETKG